MKNAVEELSDLIKEGEERILPTKWRSEGIIGSPYRVNLDAYVGWYVKTLSLLKSFLPANSDFVSAFKSCEENLYSNAVTCVEVLKGVVDYIEKGFLSFNQQHLADPSTELRRIFSKFHRIARQLRSRYNNRETIQVEDEYDVQDLLHALLRLYFDDIRREEWTPSYAGKCSRMDFLLKREKIVIEVKKTRQSLTEKELGDQLIVDVERYKVHPDCEKLICFIYDPEGRIGNPEGLIQDLDEQNQGFVKVIVEPLN